MLSERSLSPVIVELLVLQLGVFCSHRATSAGSTSSNQMSGFAAVAAVALATPVDDLIEVEQAKQTG